MNEAAIAVQMPEAPSGPAPHAPQRMPDGGQDFAALFDSVVLEPPGASASRPSMLKDVALAQQALLTEVAAPLPDVSNVPLPQAMNLLTQKMSQMSMAHMGFSMALSAAGATKKSVESVLNQK